MNRRTAPSPEQALQKAKHYCAYQERCHAEVKEKLYSLGLYKQQVEQLLATLIEEDYLNEARFAIQFAGGRFRMKNWGRVKIRYELKQKQVSEYCIRKALLEINEADYLKTLDKLARVKLASIKTSTTNRYSQLAKLTDYLLQKGFERDLIAKTLNEMLPAK